MTDRVSWQEIVDDTRRYVRTNFPDGIPLADRNILLPGRTGGAAAPAAGAAQAATAGPSAETLDNYCASICTCTSCRLAETRTSFVFGEGSPTAGVMFIGEGPGRDEDLQGRPFVGEAGQLLTKIIEAIDFTRDDVYIANIVKCRPPGNRDPKPDEIGRCMGYLERQIELIRPAVICTLGRIAAQSLLDTSQGMMKLRGQVYEWRGIKVVPTFHPAALLRNPHWKRPTWEDVQLVRKIHDELRGS